jgi:hypothetical protein
LGNDFLANAIPGDNRNFSLIAHVKARETKIPESPNTLQILRPFAFAIIK